MREEIETKVSERPGGEARIQRYRPNHVSTGGFVDVPAEHRPAVALALLGKSVDDMANIGVTAVWAGTEPWGAEEAELKRDVLVALAAIFGPAADA